MLFKLHAFGYSLRRVLRYEIFGETKNLQIQARVCVIAAEKKTRCVSTVRLFKLTFAAWSFVGTKTGTPQ